jgi:hypothetical protein
MKPFTALSYIVLPGILFTLFLFYSACQPKNNLQDNAAAKKTKDTADSKKIIAKPPASFSDTLLIDITAAVFFQPDSAQLLKIKAVNAENIYKTITHELFYLMRNARNVLKQYWPKIKILETNHARYLKFIGKSGHTSIIDLNTKNDIGGIILFNREKEPQMIDMMNIDTELNFYFSK